MPRTRAATLLPWLAFAWLLAACGSDGVDGADSGGSGCRSDADCHPFDDGDLCNGTLTCDVATGQCQLAKKSVVDCDTSADGACVSTACVPATGKCEAIHTPDGRVCEDGDPCSGGDRCKGGSCVAGPYSLCDCKADKDCPDDGDKCNGSQICDKKILPWRCRVDAKSVPSCADDGSPCLSATCDPITGKCTSKKGANGTSCDDGDACTGNDACADGSCVGAPICSCKKDADCVAQEDGDLCNGTLFCDTGKGKCAVDPKSVVQCPPAKDGPCVKNECAPTTGICKLVASPTATACDDEDACTAADHCAGGTCVGGTDTCTCKEDADCAKLEDGDGCNGVLFCDATSGECKHNPASVIVCPSVGDTACAKNVCLPQEATCATRPRADVVQQCNAGTGTCHWQLKGKGEAGDKGPFPCDDGQVCTTGATCAGTSCKASAIVCKCQSDADCEAKDDGDKCNGTWYCDKSLKVADCVFNPASKVFCSPKDDTACLKATCDSKTGACGLQPVSAGVKCDDGKACTDKSSCLDGKCQGGQAKICDDGDSCTIDACVSGKAGGCTFQQKQCDDGNSCTGSSCEAKTGKCDHAPKKAGLTCNADGDGCTVNDVCDGKGTCAAGKPLACLNKTDACHEAVCQSQGAAGFQCVVVALDDGAPCPDGAKSCFVGAACKAGSCLPGKVPKRFSTWFGANGADVVFEAVDQHQDGGLVAAGSWRGAGAKLPGWYAVATTATGEVKWQYKPVPSGHVDAVATGVVADNDGTTWVAGAQQSPAEKLEAAWVRLNKAGKVVFTGQFHPPAIPKRDDRAWQLQRAPGGGLLMAVTSSPPLKGKGHTLSIVRIGDAGKVSWHHTYNESLSADRNGIAVAGNGRIFISHVVQSGNLRLEWLPPGAKGDHTFTFEYPGKGQDGGSVWADQGHVYLARFAAGQYHVGRYPWEGGHWANKSGPAKRRPRALVPAGAKHLLVVGHTEGGGKADAWLAVHDRTGNFQWERTWGGEGDDQVNDAVAVDGDNMVVAGYRTDKSGWRKGWLARTGPWGDLYCSVQGPCAGLRWKDCDDGNPCTADRCDQVGGCKFSVPSYSRCEAPNECSAAGLCKQGKCVGTAEGRYRINKLDGDKTRPNAMGLHQRKPEEFLAFTAGKRPEGRYEKRFFLNSRGSLITSPITKYPNLNKCLVDVAHRIVPLADHGYVVMGHRLVGGKTLAHACRLPKSFNPVTWQLSAPSKKQGGQTSGRDVAEFADGSVYLLHRDASAGGWGLRLLQNAGSGQPTVKGASATVKGVDLDGQALAILSDASVVVVGAAKVGAKLPAAHLARVSPDLKMLWLVNATGAHTRTLYDATTTANDTVIAVGESRLNALARQQLVIGCSKAGKVLWTHEPKLPDQVRLKAVVALSPLRLLLAGDVHSAGKQGIWVARTDGHALPIWQRIHRGQGNATARLSPGELLVMTDGGMMLGGSAASAEAPFGTIHRATIWRLGPWGEVDCSKTGKCAAKVAKDCDDGKLCTADVCDPAAGCVHSALEGSPCADGKTCKVGQCAF